MKSIKVKQSILIKLCIVWASLWCATANAAPSLTLGVVNGQPGETANVPVSFNNNGSVAGLQFDVQYDTSQLGAGTAIAGTGLASTGHGIASSHVAANTLRIVITPPADNAVIDTTSNNIVVELPFIISGIATNGDKTLSLINVILSKNDSTRVDTDLIVAGIVSVFNGDTDGDGMPDSWETANGLNLNDATDAALDGDTDGLSNLQEFENNTDPANWDSDVDGMADGWEVQYGLNPLDAVDATQDLDGDGLSNLDEYQQGTDPVQAIGAINFNDYTILNFDSGAQDVTGPVTIEDAGATLHMVGNRWKKIEFPYTLTANTVLEFDFVSTKRGEIHGIGFTAAVDATKTFKVFGTQAWGLVHETYNAGGGVQHFKIPVTEYMNEGNINHLVFVNDHDVSSPTAESYFSNVRVYEDDSASGSINAAPTANAGIDQSINEGGVVNLTGTGTDTDGTIASYAWSQVSGTAVTLTGVATANASFTAPTVTAIETLTFALIVTDDGGTASVADQINVTVNPVVTDDSDGDGMPDSWETANGLNPNDATDAALDGDTDGLSNLQEFENNTDPSLWDSDVDGIADGWEVQYGLIPLDATDAAQDPDGDGVSNLDEYQQGTNPVQNFDVINFNDYTILGLDAGAQDVTGPVTVEDGGVTLHMVGNRWKKIAFSYTATPNTVLEFDFSSTNQGDIHGIGFATVDPIGPDSGKTFNIFGTQVWGISNHSYDAGGSVQHFKIPLSEASFTGNIAYLVFVNDHDILSPTAESYFSNVRIYEP